MVHIGACVASVITYIDCSERSPSLLCMALVKFCKPFWPGAQLDASSMFKGYATAWLQSTCAMEGWKVFLGGSSCDRTI
jgi:hypothetical protein